MHTRINHFLERRQIVQADQDMIQFTYEDTYSRQPVRVLMTRRQALLLIQKILWALEDGR